MNTPERRKPEQAAARTALTFATEQHALTPDEVATIITTARGYVPEGGMMSHMDMQAAISTTLVARAEDTRLFQLDTEHADEPSAGGQSFYRGMAAFKAAEPEVAALMARIIAVDPFGTVMTVCDVVRTIYRQVPE
jgi:hypothetical protein